MARDWYEIKVSFEPLSDGSTNARVCYTGNSGRTGGRLYDPGGIGPRTWTGGKCAIGQAPSKKAAATKALNRLRKTAPPGARLRIRVKR